MYYTVYKVTNSINGKIYIGVHATNNLYDNYMGSGDKIKLAIQQHGIKNFKKEILFIYNTLQEALQTESEIVDEDFIRRNDTYNVIPGGGYPPLQKGKSKAEKKQSLKGILRTEAQKEAALKHSKRMLGRSPWNKGKPGKGRPVRTPDGVFKNGLEARKFYNLSSGALVNRCKKKLYGFSYADETV